MSPLQTRRTNPEEPDSPHLLTKEVLTQGVCHERALLGQGDCFATLATTGGRVKKAARSISSGNRKTSAAKQTGNQCTFTSADGRRCQQKRWLQFHHVVPVAQGGLNTAQNLKLLCTQHHHSTHSNGVAWLSGAKGPGEKKLEIPVRRSA